MKRHYPPDSNKSPHGYDLKRAKEKCFKVRNLFREKNFFIKLLPSRLNIFNCPILCEGWSDRRGIDLGVMTIPDTTHYTIQEVIYMWRELYYNFIFSFYLLV